jgi:hypothetical protein
MENKKNDNQNRQQIKKFEGTGQFPTDSQGRIINNTATGYDTATRSFEIYKKTPKEKLDLSLAKSVHKSFLKMKYGNDWKKYNS